MEKIIEKSIEIKEKPRLVQKNFAEVNADLAEYIRKGKPYPLDERLFQCFNKMMTKNQNISNTVSVFVTIFGILILTSLFIPLIGAIITGMQLSKNPGQSTLIMFICSIIAIVGMLAFGVFLLFLSSKLRKQCNSYSEVIKKAKYGQAECFRYRCHYILRYSYFNGDSTNHIYYANLDDFIVELLNPTDKWPQADYAYGVIIKMNNKDVFYLFNELE